ncbi:MAG: hypothetical protein P8J29_04655 [Rhodospirillales bacterium]|nr:hypothetical protein [Rhodospirillales bacterium]
MPYFLLFLTLFGLALFLPGLSRTRVDWLGFRFFAAALGTPLYLFLGNVLLGVSVSVLAWSLAAFGIASLIFALLKGWPEKSKFYLYILHPVLILPIIFCVVVAYQGGIEYLPFPGDEVASWLKYARQIYVVDSFWSKNIDYHLGGYTNGWPLYVAFSNVYFGQFSDSHASILPFLMHVGLLGFVFDVGKFFLRRSGVVVSLHLSLVPWTLVLLLLSLEASWILFPTFQVVDHPLLYAFLGVFLIGLMGQFEEVDLNRVAVSLGLLFAAGYLIKMTMLAAGPAIGIFWLSFLWRRYKASEKKSLGGFLIAPRELLSHAKLATVLLGPLGGVALGWSMKRFGTHCFSSPLTFFSESHSLTSDISISVAQIIGEAISTYVWSFKFSLTFVSVFVLIVCLKWVRIRWFVLALITFLLFYVVTIHSAYTLCFSPFGEQGLQSFYRYYRPNLRLLHFVAPILGFYMLTEGLRRYPALGRWVRAKSTLAICGLFVLIAVSNQFQGLLMSLEEIRTRNSYGRYVRETIVTMKLEAQEMSAIIQKRQLRNPSISLIAQAGYHVEIELAQYFGIKSYRSEIPLYYRIERPYSWGKSRFSRFTTETSEPALQNWWRGYAVIWPVRTDEWTRRVLATLVDDTKCEADPEAYFLFNRGDGTFECVAKSRPSNLLLR